MTQSKKKIWRREATEGNMAHALFMLGRTSHASARRHTHTHTQAEIFNIHCFFTVKIFS